MSANTQMLASIQIKKNHPPEKKDSQSTTLINEASP